MSELITVENLVALLTLTSLEVVLGIDNLVFLAIITGKLDPAVQVRARRTGLLLAMGFRIALLLAINWIMGLDQTLFSVAGLHVTGHKLILLVGGLFLLAKATYEIHENLEASHDEHSSPKAAPSFGLALVQIVAIDLVFSLDSVITAVGMARSVVVMIIAIVLAIVVMLVFAEAVTRFIERHPTLKMLALSFLLLIGVMLVAEGFDQHINRAYIYFAMGFSLFVEILNIRIRKSGTPVKLLKSPTVE